MSELKQNEQGHEKKVTIFVNGRAKVVTEKEISFEEVVSLWDNRPTGENILYTVVYRKGDNGKQGTLVAGQAVKVKEGMIFDVTATNKS